MTALVFSAGGLYCAFQAGAFRAITELGLRFDMVLGASAGALNGWPVAGGCTPEELIQRWLDPATSNILRLKPEPGWKNGYFETDRLREQTEKIMREFQPQVPFSVALVKLPWFRTVMVSHPDVTAPHLVASCSIPIVMPSVSIDGTSYVDGGLIEKMPLRAAVAMGATRIIAIDALPDPEEWWLRTAMGVARSLKPRRSLPKNVVVTTVKPSEALGPPNDAVFWNRSNIERWIELGYRDTRAALLQGWPGSGPESGISK